MKKTTRLMSVLWIMLLTTGMILSGCERKPSYQEIDLGETETEIEPEGEIVIEGEPEGEVIVEGELEGEIVIEGEPEGEIIVEGELEGESPIEGEPEGEDETTKPIITFSCPDQDNIMDVIVSIPEGTDISNYAWSSVGESFGEVAGIGIAGPGGWDWQTNPYFVQLLGGGSNELIGAGLTTGFEPWNTNHFQGAVFIVDNNGEVAWLMVEQFTVNFNGNYDVVIDDGSGGLIIDFDYQDGNCE